MWKIYQMFSKRRLKTKDQRYSKFYFGALEQKKSEP